MQTDYKNWVPKGMVKALALATCICAVFLFVLTAAVTVAPSTARWAGFGVFLTGFLACGIALLWAVTAYRAFSFTGKRQLSRQIIDGVASYVNLPENAKGLDVGCGSGALTIACAKALLEKCPDFDVILTAEAKGIPLAYEMSRQSGKQWIPARKGVKGYMTDPVIVEDQSITTAGKQTLVIDKKDLDYMNGKRILVVDDVISTGGSLHALDALAARSSGTIVAQAAVLAEGDAAERKDIIFLEPLPLFAH